MLRAGTDDVPSSHPRSARAMAEKPEQDETPAARAEDIAALQKKLDAQAAQLATFAEQETTRKAQETARQAEIDALKAENAQAKARARVAEADRFVQKFASKDCLKLVTLGEQAVAKRLHEALAALPEQVVTFSEDGKDVQRTLLADFEALIAARPDAKALLTEVSRATQPTQTAESMDDVVKLIATERKLDLSKPTWKRDATVILCSEEPYKTTYAHLIAPPGPARH